MLIFPPVTYVPVRAFAYVCLCLGQFDYDWVYLIVAITHSLLVTYSLAVSIVIVS